MSKSLFFGSRTALKPHLVIGPGGIPAEVADLRQDVELAFQQAYRGETDYCGVHWVTPPTPSTAATAIKLSVASSKSPVSYTGASLDGTYSDTVNPVKINSPRKVTLTVGGTGADWTGGNVTIVGKDPLGAAQTEIFSATAGTGVKSSTKLFSSVTSIGWVAQGDVGATITVGVITDLDAIGSYTTATTAQVLKPTGTLAVNGKVVFDPPRPVSMKTSSSADFDLSNLVIKGMDVEGRAVTDTLSIPNNGGTTVAGVVCFSEIHEIDFPVQSGTGGTLELTYKDVFGLPGKILDMGGTLYTTSVIKEIVTSTVVTSGAVAKAATNLPYGSYTPSAAPLGVNDFVLVFLRDLNT